MQIATQKEIEIVDVLLDKLQRKKIKFRRFVRISEAIIRREANRQNRLQENLLNKN